VCSIVGEIVVFAGLDRILLSQNAVWTLMAAISRAKLLPELSPFSL
jgi:hypothetical protein